MKELEALKKIYNAMYNKLGFIEEFKLLEQALTPPTEEEVEKALGAYLKCNVSKTESRFIKNNDVSQIISFYGYGVLKIYEILPPHLITLIGRFYEGLEK